MFPTFTFSLLYLPNYFVFSLVNNFWIRKSVFVAYARLNAASMASTNVLTPATLSLRNGCRCVPDPAVSVEDMLLVFGEKIGFENIVSASRMNKAVVVFLKSESLVNDLTVSGVWVKETYVPVTPLSAPATKVTISNVPPFICNEAILKELQRFGKIASPVKAVPLRCKNAALKHVLSFRRQVFMFLNSPERTLDVSFRVTYEESSFMVYASTDSMRCYECGDVGHKRLTCPHKDEQRASTSREDTSNTGAQRPEQQAERATDEVNERQEVSETTDTPGGVGEAECSRPTVIHKDVSECDDNEQNDAQSDVEDVCEDVTGQAGVSEENMADEMEGLSQCTDDGLRDDEQWSDVSKVVDDLYTLEQINSFLDKTKGRAGVEVCDYFPDVEKFVSSVMMARRMSSYDELSQQKRFRLKKHLTAIRSGRKPVKARGKIK